MIALSGLRRIRISTLTDLRLSNSTKGIALMLFATAIMSVMHALVRFVSADIHPFEIAFFRNLFGLMFLLPMLLHVGRAGFLSRQPKLQIMRALVGVVALLTWFYSLSIVPIAEATALSFTSALFASIGSVLFLNERMGVRRWSAIIIGFIGALIILRPGIEAMSLGAILVLISTLAWGVSVVLVKKLSRTDSTICIVLWMSIAMTLMSFAPALWVWTTPTLAQLGWLALIGIIGSTGMLCVTEALRLTDATALMPLDFTRLIWASIIGFLLFAEIPDIWTWLGGLVIIASTTYITLREAMLKRANAKSTAHNAKPKSNEASAPVNISLTDKAQPAGG